MEKDNINHPSHYNSSPAKCECGRQIECIDVTRHENFNVGNAIKYLWRYKHKNGVEDLKKARWYINDLIEQIDGKAECVMEKSQEDIVPNSSHYEVCCDCANTLINEKGEKCTCDGFYIND